MFRAFSRRIFQMTDRNSVSSCSLKQSSWMIFICLTMANASASDPGVPVKPTTVRPHNANTPSKARKRNTNRPTGCRAVAVVLWNGVSTLPAADGRSHWIGLLLASLLAFPPAVASRMRGYSLEKSWCDVAQGITKARTGSVVSCRPIGPKCYVPPPWAVMHDL